MKGLNVVKLLIITVLLSVSTQVYAAWYFELGIGIDPYYRGAQPEVNLQPPFGKMTIGATADYGWSVEFEHISSIPEAETGNGFNSIWATKRIEF